MLILVDPCSRLQLWIFLPVLFVQRDEMLIKNRPSFFIHVILSLHNNSVTRNRYCCVIFECASAFQLFPYFIFIGSFSLYNIPSLTFVLDIFITNDRVIFSSSRFRIIHLQLIKVILSRQICILDNVIVLCSSSIVNNMYCTYYINTALKSGKIT